LTDRKCGCAIIALALAPRPRLISRPLPDTEPEGGQRGRRSKDKWGAREAPSVDASDACLLPFLSDSNCDLETKQEKRRMMQSG
jgi:hypothetical protein